MLLDDFKVRVVEMVKMSIRNIVSPSNILFVIGAIYFTVVASLHEGSVYSVIASVLCVVSVGLSPTREKWFFSSPFRAASSLFVIVLLIAQIFADIASNNPTGTFEITSFLINGILFVFFAGVALACINDIVKKEPSEEEEEKDEAKPTKKITYEI